VTSPSAHAGASARAAQHLHVVPDPPPVLRPEPSGLVSRIRLVRRLRATSARLGVLVAPAGYGKTTLLAQWERQDERPFAWVAVEEKHNDPAVLLAAIAGSLDDAGRSGPAVVVLDDAHRLHGRTAVAALESFVARLEPGSMLVLAARGDLPLPLGGVRARRDLVELRAHDLAMDETEAGTLLRCAGVHLADADVVTVMRRTEGWPAGLYLAALAVHDQEDLGAAVARFRGDDRLVADFLRCELLSELTPAEVAFLTRTSMLDPLTGPLCDAVLERRGSAQMLRRLAHSNILLAPLDRSEEQFRLHPLLAEMLRGELRCADPVGKADLHARASAWYERHRDDGRAIDHAIAAGNPDRAGALLLAVAPIYAADGRNMLLGRWLGLLPDAQIAAGPALSLAAAVHHVTRGDRDAGERWTNAAERALGASRHAPPAAVAAGIALMRAAIARKGVVRMSEDAARAYALDDDDGPWRGAACLLAGTARHLAGDLDPARDHLEEGVRRARISGATGVEMLSLAQLALIALEDGDPQLGERLAEASRRPVQPDGAIEASISVLVHAVSAFAAARRGHLDEARREIAEARRQLPGLADSAPWYGAEARIALARAELRLGNAADARALLTEASRGLRRTSGAPVLQAWIDDAWERADSFAAGAVCGASSLTTAELRVLRFLPSHESLREIAERLHVSANTVKSQAHAVYRKLDASSRSEAVSRARDVGLVDD
jgi:LuxR family transcriptional regulator, maltose regulon positive regulatory protein